MKFDDLLVSIGESDHFDLPTLIQLCGGRRETIVVQLHRWVQSGKIHALRRGLYILAEQYRKVPVRPSKLANEIHSPSYLTHLWALAYYGLIPEMVVTYISVTPRNPRLFRNILGTFQYTHIKQKYFFGYEMLSVNNVSVRIAKPEKALLDHWYLTPGKWTAARLSEMRYQNAELIDIKLLSDYAEQFNKPKLDRLVKQWIDINKSNAEGTTVI